MNSNKGNGYSFCIITDNNEPKKLQREIASIHALKLPAYEINIVEDSTPPLGRISELRNKVCRMARYDHLIIADDDIFFHKDFYRGLQKYGEDYDVLSCRILNPDGSRFYDWKVHVKGKNYLLDYDKTDPNISLTGGFCIMKQWVFKRIQWNDELGYYEEEDVDFTEQLKNEGIRISFNPYCTVTHDALYKQVGRTVIRMDFKGRLSYARHKLLIFLGVEK
jgi:GT2 family glycosyltransferase